MIRHLQGDFFTNIFIFSGTELFSHFFVGLIINQLSLNTCYLLAFLTAALSSLLYSATRLGHPEVSPYALGLIIFGIIFSTNTNWNGNQFLFPVVYASSTNGICNIFARGVNMVSPQIAEMRQPIPMLVVCGTCAIAAGLSLLLKPIKKSD